MISLKSIKKLEFDLIINSYKKYCYTTYGIIKFDNINFYYDKNILEYELNIITEFLENLRKGINLPLSGFSDITEDLQNIKNGLILEKESAYKVFLFLLNSEKLIKAFSSFYAPLFKSKYDINYNFENEISSIKHIFTDSGNISDKASSKLYSIRKEIQKKEKEFLEIISNIANKYKDYLVSENYVLKDNRYLLPVKLSKKNNVNGIAFGFSDSGKTILIEPIEIIEINNIIYQLKAEEELEIARILHYVTQLYISSYKKINDFINLLANIDFVNAKAKIAFENGYNRIEINNNYIFKLNQFYHPLLEKPVKNSIEFGDKKQFVVITGPNAGGKSVTLKAIGLIQLLFQAGFFVPASSGSSLPILKDILIDIGDMQSIEQSLSTFSSHILELKKIIEKASGDTLILIDELGTATSPLEGEALAVSILENLIEKGSFGIITSHFDLVKKFAIENSSTIIASMLFDENLMLPRYILMIDLPGYSYAFEIAERLGIPKYIIDRAKFLSKIDNENSSISKQLSSLVLKYKEELINLNNFQNELLNKEKEINILKQKFNKTAKEIEREILTEVNGKLNELRKDIENQISLLKKEGYSKNRSKELMQNFNRFQEEINIYLQNYNKEEENTKEEKNIEIKEIEIFQIGDIVQTGILGKKGQIIYLDKDKAKVQIDNFILEVPVKNLKKVENNENKKYSNI
ncbi:MAG: endonuclease MutS2, partial [Exilispira sp.]